MSGWGWGGWRWGARHQQWGVGGGMGWRQNEWQALCAEVLHSADAQGCLPRLQATAPLQAGGNPITRSTHPPVAQVVGVDEALWKQGRRRRRRRSRWGAAGGSRECQRQPGLEPKHKPAAPLGPVRLPAGWQPPANLASLAARHTCPHPNRSPTAAGSSGSSSRCPPAGSPATLVGAKGKAA